MSHTRGDDYLICAMFFNILKCYFIRSPHDPHIEESRYFLAHTTDEEIMVQRSCLTGHRHDRSRQGSLSQKRGANGLYGSEDSLTLLPQPPARGQNSRVSLLAQSLTSAFLSVPQCKFLHCFSPNFTL